MIATGSYCFTPSGAFSSFAIDCEQAKLVLNAPTKYATCSFDKYSSLLILLGFGTASKSFELTTSFVGAIAQQGINAMSAPLNCGTAFSSSI